MLILWVKIDMVRSVFSALADEEIRDLPPDEIAAYRLLGLGGFPLLVANVEWLKKKRDQLVAYWVKHPSLHDRVPEETRLAIDMLSKLAGGTS